MAYWEWGDPANAARAGVRARPDAPGARLRHAGASPVPATTAWSAPTWWAAAAPTGWPTRLGYPIPAYVADMVTLLARLNAAHGRLGGHLHGRADRHRPGRAGGLADLRRLVLNDVGPDHPVAALAAHRRLLGQPPRWASVDEAARRPVHLHRLRPAHAASNGCALTRAAAQARRATASCCTTTRHRACPSAATTMEVVKAGEAMLWAAYDRVKPPGAAAARRRVRPAVARDGQAMTPARPEGAARRVRRRRPRADTRAPDQVKAVREFLLAP